MKTENRISILFRYVPHSTTNHLLHHHRPKQQQQQQQQQQTTQPHIMSNDKTEIGHYVVTAHPSGSVLSAVQCSFLSPNSRDVVIAKSTRIEIRQYQPPPTTEDDDDNNDDHHHTNNNNNAEAEHRFPLLLTLPINGRIASLSPIRFTNSQTDCLFFTTDRGGVCSHFV